MADVSVKPIRRLLVANRGEIARRIFRTAHRMGIGSVAIYADGDARAPFVQEADTAIALNGIAKILDVLGTRADAEIKAGNNAAAALTIQQITMISPNFAQLADLKAREQELRRYL